jgi:hypothetical protein
MSLYAHTFTGIQVVLITTAYNLERKEHQVVYLETETGRMYSRSRESFERLYYLLRADPQADIEPEIDY